MWGCTLNGNPTIRPASLNSMMKQAFAKYSNADLDRILARHPRQYQVPLLKKMFTEPYDPKAVQQSRRALGETLVKIDKNLAEKGPWLAGSCYSLADIAAAPVIDRIQRLGMANLWDNLPGGEGLGRASDGPPSLSKGRSERRIPDAGPQAAGNS